MYFQRKSWGFILKFKEEHASMEATLALGGSLFCVYILESLYPYGAVGFAYADIKLLWDPNEYALCSCQKTVCSNFASTVVINALTKSSLVEQRIYRPDSGQIHHRGKSG